MNRKIEVIENKEVGRKKMSHLNRPDMKSE